MRYIQSFQNENAIQDALDNKTLGKPYVALNNQTGEIDWDEKDPGFIAQYFTIEVISAGTVNLTLATGGTVNMQYSVDGGQTWQNNASINAQPGDKIMYKGNNDSLSAGSGSYSKFADSTATFKAYGNVMSLLYGNNFTGQTAFPVNSRYNFTSLFENTTGLVDVSNLVLPVSVLTQGCYYYMFSHTSITQPPVISATTLAQQSFGAMYSNCSGITDASNFLPPITALTENCYQGMFRDCTNLTIAPELPATTLAKSCYKEMFRDCTNLTIAPELPATTLAKSCYRDMFYGCTSLTTAPELPATTLADYCYSSMFSNCTGLTAAPSLPATTLVTSCYNNMFHNCTSLNYIKCLATNISATNCTNNWVEGVSATGTFVKDSSMSNWTIGNNGIPSGWTFIPDIYVLDSEGNYYYPQEDPYGKYYEFEFTIDVTDSWTLYKDNEPVEVESGYFTIFNECNGNSKTVDQLTFPHTFENETYTGGFNDPSLAVRLNWYPSQSSVEGGVTAQYCDGSDSSGSAES